MNTSRLASKSVRQTYNSQAAKQACKKVFRQVGNQASSQAGKQANMQADRLFSSANRIFLMEGLIYSRG